MKKQRWRFTKNKIVTCVECEKKISVKRSHEGKWTLCSARCHFILVGVDRSEYI